AVSRRAFRDREPDVGDPREVWGWVAIHDPLITTFTPADLFFAHHLVLGFRYDRRLVPPKLLALERRRLENERKAARGVDRLGTAERREDQKEEPPKPPAGRPPQPPALGRRSRIRDRPGFPRGTPP